MLPTIDGGQPKQSLSRSRILQQLPQHRPLTPTNTTFIVWTSSIPSSLSAQKRPSPPLFSRPPCRTSKINLKPSTRRFPTIPMLSLSHRILAVKSFSRSQRRRTGPNGAGTTSRLLRVRTNDSNARTLRTRACKSTDSTVRSLSRAEMSLMQHSTSSHPPNPRGRSIPTRGPIPLPMLPMPPVDDA